MPLQLHIVSLIIVYVGGHEVSGFSWRGTVYENIARTQQTKQFHRPPRRKSETYHRRHLQPSPQAGATWDGWALSLAATQTDIHSDGEVTNNPEEDGESKISVGRPRGKVKDDPSSSSFALAIEEMSQQFQGLSIKDIHQGLVRLGTGNADNRSDDLALLGAETCFTSSADKVPGCIANVCVQTRIIVMPTSYPNTLHERDESFRDGKECVFTRNYAVGFDDENDHYQPDKSSCRSMAIEVVGHADALVSRGLLALLTRTLHHKPIAEVLQYDPYQIVDAFGIRSALSHGRNDGLASMLSTIQQQIRSILPKTMSTGKRSHQPEDVVENHKLCNGEDSTSEVGDFSFSPPSLSRPKARLNGQKQRVALLLSGGVDSSVALHMLLKEGRYDITAFYLRIWLEDELAHLGQCPWEEDYRTCQEVCLHAGDIPLEAISLQKEYRQRIIEYTIRRAERGHTPNPDILCNSRIKFGVFYDAIASRGFDFVATGHYARIIRSEDNAGEVNSAANVHPSSVRLFRAPDPVKDQSYFLCALTQNQLRRVLFPIGHLEKSQVRQIAHDLQLPNRNRRESQGLCFLGKVRFEDFLRAYLGDRPGPIIDAATGDSLGRHQGVWFHTVGQRKGIGKVLDPLATSRGPWYVVAKHPSNNIVYCSNQYDDDQFAAARSLFTVEDIHWIAGEAPRDIVVERGVRNDEDEHGMRLLMKIRHGPRAVAGLLTLSRDSSAVGTVLLDEKDGGLAPGQYVVFYTTESECLGGGVISEQHWAQFLYRDQISTEGRQQQLPQCSPQR